jgi:hypothetical protein
LLPEELANLGLFTSYARQLLDALGGFGHGMRGPLDKFLLQRQPVRPQGALWPVTPVAAHRHQAAGPVEFQYPLHRGTRETDQFGDVLMPLAMGLEPEHLHAPLHPRVRVAEAIMPDLFQYRRRKLEVSHPCALP